MAEHRAFNSGAEGSSPSPRITFGSTKLLPAPMGEGDDGAIFVFPDDLWHHLEGLGWKPDQEVEIRIVDGFDPDHPEVLKMPDVMTPAPGNPWSFVVLLLITIGALWWVNRRV